MTQTKVRELAGPPAGTSPRPSVQVPGPELPALLLQVSPDLSPWVLRSPPPPPLLPAATAWQVPDSWGGSPRHRSAGGRDSYGTSPGRAASPPAGFSRPCPTPCHYRPARSALRDTTEVTWQCWPRAGRGLSRQHLSLAALNPPRGRGHSCRSSCVAGRGWRGCGRSREVKSPAPARGAPTQPQGGRGGAGRRVLPPKPHTTSPGPAHAVQRSSAGLTLSPVPGAIVPPPNQAAVSCNNSQGLTGGGDSGLH